MELLAAVVLVIDFSALPLLVVGLAMWREFNR